MVPALQLIPAGRSSPLRIEAYTWSRDLSLLLVFTNSQRVWREKTRGDYWVLDRTSRQLWQLGGQVGSSQLMFAKFSPGGRQVAYVRDGNIYVEDLDDRRITALTATGSRRHPERDV